MVKLRVYFVCTGSQEPAFAFWAKYGRGLGGSRGWSHAMTLDCGQVAPLCRFGSLLSSADLDRATGSYLATPSGKTHIIEHVFMSLQFLNRLCKSPLRYHCISLITDFQRRLTCNRRANWAFGFRACSFLAGNSRHIWWD